MTKQIK